jgi:hypothetical protein
VPVTSQGDAVGYHVSSVGEEPPPFGLKNGLFAGAGGCGELGTGGRRGYICALTSINALV